MAATGVGAASGMEGLRPLELSELLDRTFSLYRRNFATFALIAGAPYILLFLVSTSVEALGQRLARTGAAVGASFPLMVLLGVLVGIVLYLAAYAASQAAAFYAVSETYMGRRTTLGSAFKQTRGKLLLLIGVAIYVGLATMGGFLLFLIPGLIVMCRASVAIAAALLEDLSPREAFRRSWELTKGFAWRAASILGLTFILGMVAAFIFQWPFQIVAVIARNTAMAPVWTFLAGLGGVVAQVAVAPIAFIATTVFYYDLRVRKDGFDLERLLTTMGGGSGRPSNTVVPSALGLIR